MTNARSPDPPAATPRRLALVTGASCGLGRAFARRRAAAGYDLIIVGRRRARLEALMAKLAHVEVQPLVTDLANHAGLAAVAELCAPAPLTLLVNNAGVSHDRRFPQLDAPTAREILHVKIIAPTRAAAPGRVERGQGTIINVSGMLAFGAAAPLGSAPGRAVYVASLAHLVALSQALQVELSPAGVRIQALCPGRVATEFQARQGRDLSALPLRSAEDVVTASLRSLDRGEILCAPGVDDATRLDAARQANRAAYSGQSATLSRRERAP